MSRLACYINRADERIVGHKFVQGSPTAVCHIGMWSSGRARRTDIGARVLWLYNLSERVYEVAHVAVVTCVRVCAGARGSNRA
jgi:hypothetical protein